MIGSLWYTSAFLVAASAAEQPFWGCGLLGDVRGIGSDGTTTTAAMQTLINGLKVTNKYNGKVSYWNWNYAPQDNDGGAGHQYLTKDFVFMPENWGTKEVEEKYVRPAGVHDYIDSNGKVSHSYMADIFLGANEPDIYGSCMGNMMGACTAPCTSAEVQANNCPVAHLNAPQGSGHPNAAGHCDCWTDSHATGCGFWPVNGVSSPWQPLPTCWQNGVCVTAVMSAWKKSAATIAAKGYKHLSAPLVAANMDWMKNFVTHACSGCSEISCGCPTHVGWHFYANDCQPEKGGYKNFQEKLDKTVELMEQFPHLQGALVNEVGMLNCAMDTPDANCIPNGPTQKYPAKSQPNHTCPSTPSLPHGLGSFVKQLLQMVAKAKASDGRRAVVSFTWFSLDMVGGTYNMELFNKDGTLNSLAHAYISACQAWASGTPTPPTPPTPTPPTPPAPSPPTPPAPTPPTPTPPSHTCKVDDSVHCPGADASIMCAGDQCCPGGVTCPSASDGFAGCPKPKSVDCLPSVIFS